MYSNTPNSPPLHHPIPQHPIPPFRSPPPAEGFQSVGNVNQQSNPYIPQDVGTTDNGSQPSGMMFSGAGTSYTNFLSDPSAQIGIEVGRNALNYGQEYIGKNVSIIGKSIHFGSTSVLVVPCCLLNTSYIGWACGQIGCV